MAPKELSLALTPGSENGVGPELMLLAAQSKSLELKEFFWCGDRSSIMLAADRAGVKLSFAHDQAFFAQGAVINFFPDLPQSMSRLERQACFLRHAVDVSLAGKVQAIVTGPIEKEALAFLGPNIAGQTEYFSSQLGRLAKPLMSFMGAPFIMSLMTTHVPLSEVASLISADFVLEHLRLLADECSLILKKKPSELTIDVLGLNPHAGEQGLLGREEIEHIVPALKHAQSIGLNVSGPWPADGYFAYWHTKKSCPDILVAFYHDQGLIPYKLLSQGRAVNVSLGLRIPRTSPAHGTAVELVASSQASALSSIMAIETALRLAEAMF